MKNEAIGRLLKQSGRSTVFYQYDENGEVLRQYISNGYAVYPVDERMPILDEAAIRLFFRLPEDEDKLVIHERTMPESLDFEDLSALSECLMRQGKISILYQGKRLLPLYDVRGRCWLLDTAYLKPLDDMDGVTLHLTEFGDGHMIVAKQGLVTWAMIVPTPPVDDMLQELHEADSTLERQVYASVEDGQMSMEDGEHGD